MRKFFEKVSQIVKVFDIPPFQAGSGEAFRYRLEVSHSEEEQAYTGQVYRLETYRLQPTFPQLRGTTLDWSSDALIFVMDEVFDPTQLRGATVEEVLVKFKFAFENIFGKTISRNANLWQ